MSLLLDALKKSEAQRSRGEIPKFESTAVPQRRGSGPRALYSWLLGLVLVLVVLVGVATWWLAPGAREDAATATSPVGQGPGDAGSARPGVATAPLNGTRAASVSASADSGEAVPPSGQVATTGAVEPAPRAETQAESTAEQASAADAQTPTQTQASEPAAAEQLAEAIEIARPKPVPEPARGEPAPEPTQQPAPAAERNNWIRPWELPQADRARFPELRLSVHFYATKPEDRFVLINGEQYREGDRLEGVRIAEIRRRGVVLDFGSYRVFLE